MEPETDTQLVGRIYKAWATLVVLVAVVLAVLGYVTIQNFHRNQECEARRGTGECYAETVRRHWDGRDGDRDWWSDEFRLMPIPPTRPPDYKPRSIAAELPPAPIRRAWGND